MANLFSAILIVSASILQGSLVTRIKILQGHADLMLVVLVAIILQEDLKPDWRWGILAGLILSLSSALPLWVLLASYSASASITYFLRLRVLQIPMLSLFTSVLIGTILIDGSTMLYLWLMANPLNFVEALNFVILPRIVINMLIALPILAIIGELSKIFIPSELLE